MMDEESILLLDWLKVWTKLETIDLHEIGDRVWIILICTLNKHRGMKMIFFLIFHISQFNLEFET